MRPRLYHLSGAAAACGAAAASLLLATYVIDRVALWDVAAFRELVALGDHPHVSGFAHGIIQLADPLPTAAMLAAICVAGLAWGRPRHAAAAALLVGGAAITGLTLKALLAHPRYQALLGTNQLAADAFPSGHATTAMSVSLAAVLVAPRGWRPVATVAAILYSLTVGVSLVILGRHYPSDVLGALLVCGALGLLAVAALQLIEGHSRTRGVGGAHGVGGARGVGGTRGVGAWPSLGRVAGMDRPLLALAGVAASIGLAASLTQAHQMLSYAATHTSAVVAATGISLASVALVYAIATEADGR